MKRASESHKIRYITAGVCSIAGCFLMVAFPQTALTGVRAGIDLFSKSVLPTLFPFFILVDFLGSLGVPERVGRLFEPVFRRLFLCSGTGAFIWMFSLFSGYPMAAKLVGESIRSGKMGQTEGKRILSFSCVSGPLFMVGTVGTVMLKNPGLGYLIAVGHYVGALINGLIFCHGILPKTGSLVTTFGLESSQPPIRRTEEKPISLFTLLSESILKAFRTLGLILGYIVIFSVAAEFLRPYPLGIFGLGLEMTMGCHLASELPGLSGPLRLGLCGTVLAFGGCSIAGQSMAMLAGSGIGITYYLYMKLNHGILSGIVTAGLMMLLQACGFVDLPVGLVYGSDNEVIRMLGGFHTTIFHMGSVVTITILMVMICGLDRWVHGRIINDKKDITERRNDDEGSWNHS